MLLFWGAVTLTHLLTIAVAKDNVHGVDSSRPLWLSRHERCNCGNVQEQCSKTGDCVSGCKPGFSFFNCQQASITTLPEDDLTLTAPPILLDGNDSTCLTEKDAFDKKVEFRLTKVKEIHFISLHIVGASARLTQPSTMPSVRLTGLGSHVVTNPNMTVLETSRTSLLFKKTNAKFHKLVVVYLPPDTCTVDLVIGRNLALYGTARTTSPKQEGTAWKAIDGYGKICTKLVAAKDARVEWTLSLMFPAKINLLAISSDQWELCGNDALLLKLLDGKGNTIWEQTPDNIDTFHRPYRFLMTVPTLNDLVSTVVISLDGQCSEKSKYNSVSLCEVQVFGEHVCPAQKFGPMCNHPCTTCTDKCDNDWGCPGRCGPSVPGYLCVCPVRTYGPDCHRHCSKYCAGNGSCLTDGGICSEGCRPGFEPPVCRDKTRPGVSLQGNTQQGSRSSSEPIALGTMVLLCVLLLIVVLYVVVVKLQQPRIDDQTTTQTTDMSSAAVVTQQSRCEIDEPYEKFKLHKSPSGPLAKEQVGVQMKYLPETPL